MNKYTSALAVILLSASLSSIAQQQESVFDFNALKNRAQNLAAAPYQPPDKSLPRGLQKLSYDDLRNIRFDPKAAVWRRERLPFQLQFFHRGGPRDGRIHVNLIDGELVEPVLFSKNLFTYEVKLSGRLPDDLGFNGFRIHYPLNTIEYLDELLVFQGASYFRALGKGLHYGLSARGLAINVAGQLPEEFPEFTDFWVERPDSDATSIKLYALMNSPSLTGAYQMLITPGEDTTMNIQVCLFARKPVGGLGLAPLTSMFWFGEHSASRHGDFRPEVHDSDGLLIHTGTDEWLWRPLSNETSIKVTCFADENPQGFGLLQRDRNFSSYEDLEVLYQKHPSAWVEPGSGWNRGEIRLVELPTDTEYADNIIVFWAPDEPLTPKKPLEFSYRLHWFTDNPALPPLARALNTRIGVAPEYPDAKKFVLDFSNSGGLDPKHPEAIEPIISLTNGTLKSKHLQFNPINKTWRVFFYVQPIDQTQPTEMRCFLQSDGLARSETWTYFWNP